MLPNRIKYVSIIYILLNLQALGGQIKDLNLSSGGKLVLACLDEQKNPYVLVQGSTDTIAVYRYTQDRWNLLSSQRYGALPTYSTFTSSQYCTFHKKKLYVSGITKNGFWNTSYISEYDSGKWKDIDTFTTIVGYPSSIVSLNDYIYYQAMHSGKAVIKRYSTTSKQVTIDTVLSNSMYWPSNYNTGLVSQGDSLIYFKSADSVFRYHPGSFPVYVGSVANPNLAIHFDRGVYGFNAFDGNGQVYLGKTAEYKSVPSNLIGVNQKMYSYNQNVYLVESGEFFTQNAFKTIVSISKKNGNKWSLLANLENDSDTNIVSALADSFLYLFTKSGSSFSHRSKPYGNIVRINLDSLSEPQIDSVFVWVYLDGNENGIKDFGEPLLKPQGNITTFDNPTYHYVVPDDMATIYQLFRHGGPRTCLEQKLKQIEPDVFNNPKRKDTLWFSDFDSEIDFISTAVNQFQRLDKRQTHYIRYINSKCKVSSTTSTLKITLPQDAILHSSVPNFEQKNGNQLQYNLGFSQNGYIQLELEFPFGKYNYGDTAKIYTYIENSEDANNSNNYDTSCIILRYSYDPNNKECIPSGKISHAPKEIEYTINFENEGNGYAENVLILDTLDSKLSIFDLIILGSSHPVNLSGKGNTLRWEFKGINLEPKSEINTKSKGFVHFKVRVKENLKIGDSLKNKASIFFDKNDPIVTNWSIVNRVHPDSLKVSVPSLTKHKEQMSILAYPNPAKDQLTIKNLSLKKESLTLFNAQGQVVFKVNVAPKESVLLNTAKVSPGMYYIFSSSSVLKIQVR